MAKRKQFNASVRFTDDLQDLFMELRASNGRELRAPLAELIDSISEEIEIAAGNAQQSVFMIDYLGSVGVNAVWNNGNYTNKISTANGTVAHTGVSKWHLNRLDINNANLDLPNTTVSLWDAIIQHSEGATVIFKVFNRNDKSQYVYLVTETPIIKANASTDPTPYYDLEFDGFVLKANGIESNTVDNATVAIVIARQNDVVRNNTDTFGSYPIVKNVVTLEKTEHSAIPTKDPNTLYIVPCDGLMALQQALINAAAEILFNTTALGKISWTETEEALTHITYFPLQSPLGVALPSGRQLTCVNTETQQTQTFVVDSPYGASDGTISIASQLKNMDFADGNYLTFADKDIEYNLVNP